MLATIQSSHLMSANLGIKIYKTTCFNVQNYSNQRFVLLLFLRERMILDGEKYIITSLIICTQQFIRVLIWNSMRSTGHVAHLEKM